MPTDTGKSRFVGTPEEMTLSQCAYCVHKFKGRAGCSAFGNKPIPKPILLNEFDHKNAYTGDGGVRFKRA